MGIEVLSLRGADRGHRNAAPGATHQTFYEKRKRNVMPGPFEVCLRLPETAPRKALENNRCKAHEHLQRQGVKVAEVA